MEQIKPSPEKWKEIMDTCKNAINVPQNLGEYGEYFFDYFLEVLPPIMFSNKYVLCSEPYNHNNEGATYIGVFIKNGEWFIGIFNKQKFKDLLV